LVVVGSRALLLVHLPKGGGLSDHHFCSAYGHAQVSAPFVYGWSEMKRPSLGESAMALPKSIAVDRAQKVSRGQVLRRRGLYPRESISIKLGKTSIYSIPVNLDTEKAQRH
jgi:hypothetical protein